MTTTLSSRSYSALLMLLFLFSLAACQSNTIKTYTDRIDPLLELPAMPADPSVYMPFGMIQSTPVNTAESNFLAPYSYQLGATTFYGFEHFNKIRSTHPSHPDVRLIMRAKELKEPAKMSADKELAAAGRYAVLQQYKDEKSIRAEVSAGYYSALYSFELSASLSPRLDLQALVASEQETIQISRPDSFYVILNIASNEWPLHVLVRFSSFPEEIIIGSESLAIGQKQPLSAKQAVMVHFAPKEKGARILANVAFSRLSENRLISNFEQDSQGWWLDGLIQKNKQAWRTHLSKFSIEGGRVEEQIALITSQYRLLSNIALLTESAGEFPKVNGQRQQDVSTDRYIWQGQEPSISTSYWLQLTEAATVQQMVEQYQETDLLLPTPKPFIWLSTLADNTTLAEISNEFPPNFIANDSLAWVEEQLSASFLNTSFLPMMLSGIEISPKEPQKVLFGTSAFDQIRIHVGGNAFIDQQKNAVPTSKSLSEVIHRGFKSKASGNK